MLKSRVIPVLLLKNNGLVKTIAFNKSKYLGDPINAIKIFNDKQVDELIFLDIQASKEDRTPDFELVKKIASECFMPLAYGGGISRVEHILKLFSIGVEKIIINSAVLENQSLISEAAEIFGNQSIVVCIDVKKNFWGKNQIFCHVNNKTIDLDVLEHAISCQNAGAGEIMINSVDRDGIMKGFDLELIAKISSGISIPLIVCGGAGSIEDFKNAKDRGASGIAAGSFFVYHGPHKAVLISYPSPETLEEYLS